MAERDTLNVNGTGSIPVWSAKISCRESQKIAQKVNPNNSPVQMQMDGRELGEDLSKSMEVPKVELSGDLTNKSSLEVASINENLFETAPETIGSIPIHGTNFGRDNNLVISEGSSPSSPTTFDQVPESVRRRVSSDKHRMNVMPMESQNIDSIYMGYNHKHKDGGSNPPLVTNFT